MASTRKPKALIEAEKRIADLEGKIKNLESSRDMYMKNANEASTTIEGLHEVLDDLGIKGYKDESKYYRLPLSVRLFAWAMRQAQTK